MSENKKIPNFRTLTNISQKGTTGKTDFSNYEIETNHIPNDDINFIEKYKFMLKENYNEGEDYLFEYEKKDNKSDMITTDLFNSQTENEDLFFINNEENNICPKSVNTGFQPLFNILNKKKGRCPKKRGNLIAKHTNASFDDSYKKIINKSVNKVVSDINKIIENAFLDIPKINKITGIERGYDKNLLNRKFEDILVNYRKVKTPKKDKEENKDIIEKIKDNEHIKKILDTDLHCYIDENMKKEISNLSNENEKKTWELILKNGIYNFCIGRKLRKKRKVNNNNK